MKKSFVYIIVIFVMYLLHSCDAFERHTSSEDQEIINNNIISFLNNKYSNDLSIFDKELISHFPDSIDNSYIQLAGSKSPEIGEVSLFLERSISKIEFEQLTIYYSNICKEILKPGDSLLIVNRFYNKYDIADDIKLSSSERYILDNSSTFSLPVPNFWTCNYSSDNNCHLDSSFKLYVINAEKGKFINEELLTKGEVMPIEWLNGYAKGVALSEKYMAAIYWIVVW